MSQISDDTPIPRPSEPTWHKQRLPDHFAVLGGPHPPPEGFTSDRIQILWNCGERAWRDDGQHHHTASHEVFIVLEGTIVIACGEELITVGVGETCFFPEGVWHGVTEVHPPVKALVIRTPSIPDKVSRPWQDATIGPVTNT